MTMQLGFMVGQAIMPAADFRAGFSRYLRAPASRLESRLQPRLAAPQGV
jgi:hypothetical protein